MVAGLNPDVKVETVYRTVSRIRPQRVLQHPKLLGECRPVFPLPFWAGSGFERPSVASAHTLSVSHLGVLVQTFVAIGLRDQGRVEMGQEQDEPKMGQAEWETNLQNVPERALHPLSRTLIMETLAWTPVNYWNSWSRMKLPSTSLPMPTRRTTSCLGEWSWGVEEGTTKGRPDRKGDLNSILPAEGPPVPVRSKKQNRNSVLVYFVHIMN